MQEMKVEGGYISLHLWIEQRHGTQVIRPG